MSNLCDEIGMKELEPPERCCSNCAFCENIFRTSDCHCLIQSGIANICNEDHYSYGPSSISAIGDTDKNVCELFCSKHNANSFAKIQTLAELEVLEAAGALEDIFHPLLYKMFKNRLLTKHDATDKQERYARALAEHARERSHFKDNDFFGCPPLIMRCEPIPSMSESYHFDVQMSDDKMQLRNYIGLHDGWYKENYGRRRSNYASSSNVNAIRNWAKAAGFWFDDLADSEEMYKAAYDCFSPKIGIE